MSTDTRSNRKWALLGGLGLLALMGRKRFMRRAMLTGMYGRGFAGYGYGPGRFGHGRWGQGWPEGPMTLPPFIEATLKAWHDRAHGNVPPTASAGSETAQV